MGRGVFAARPIREGEILDKFHTIQIPPDQARALAGSTPSHFWFEDDRNGSAFLVLGLMSLVNHSLSPNVDREWLSTREGEVVSFYAIHDIAPGEQLFIDYRFAGASTDPAWARG